MAEEFYVFSEEYDTTTGPFATFDLAAEEIDEDDQFSCIFTVIDGRIDEVHFYCADAEGEEFQREDSPYEGMKIEQVG